MQLWRIHIRPGGGQANPTLSYALCLRENVIGVGWQVEKDQDVPLIPDEYLRLGANFYGDEWGSGRSAVGLLLHMEVNDPVWMRSPQGIYHLCRVNGPWEYRDRPDNKDADIVNVRPVEIVQVGVETNVPGKVIACFRASRTIQRIRDDTALEASQRIWSKLTGGTIEPLSANHDIFSLISAKECEDLVYVYLQMQGWIVYPAQRQSDTLAYEFVLRHRDDFREAVVQVKTGWSPIDLGSLPSSVDVAFAFQPNNYCIGQNPKAIVIGRDEILRFISTHRKLVPSTISIWMT